MAARQPSFIERLGYGLAEASYLSELRGRGRRIEKGPDPTTQPDVARRPAIADRVAQAREALGAMATPAKASLPPSPVEPITPQPEI